jgi:magnesium-transporting ATPase (P-type)
MVDNHLSNPDPLLLTESKIMTGQGKAVVCAVGKNTLLARMRKSMDFKIEEQVTHVEKKLEFVAE